MRKVNVDRIGTADYDICQFHAMCAVGLSLRSNLGSLASAACEDFKPNWFENVENLSNNYIDQFTNLGASLDPTHYLDWARRHIRNLASSYESQNPDLKNILNSIANEIRPFGPGELKAHLRGLQRKGLQLARNCIEDWGGTKAKSVLGRLRQLSLEFLTDDGLNATSTFFDEQARTVFLVIGVGKGMLKSYLSLEFYFFHEYLSHVFPRWDDTAGKFSEGHLFAVAMLSFQRQSSLLDNGFALHRMLVEDDLKDHRRGLGKAHESNYYKLVQEKTAYASLQCDDQGRLASLLLDLAATRPTREGRFHENFLLMLRRADPQILRSTVCDCRKDLDQVYEELRASLPPFS